MLEEITSQIILYVILVSVGGAGSFIAMLYRCVRKQAVRSANQSKAILLLAKSIEEQTKFYHPEYHGGLFEEAEIILKDSNGNF
ncbi:hypothetical protein LCGC14_1511470 [marine sediment metagenome]|uniref:Uncharacterized protein n=1 Tax=marine sediment metagenome TaxID=412755 RepID=A0A0F9JM04_9ZZZZ